MASKPDITHDDIVKRLELLEESIKKHITVEKDMAETLTVALERATTDSARSVWAEHYDKAFDLLLMRLSVATEKAARGIKKSDTVSIINAINNALDRQTSGIGTALIEIRQILLNPKLLFLSSFFKRKEKGARHEY